MTTPTNGRPVYNEEDEETGTSATSERPIPYPPGTSVPGSSTGTGPGGVPIAPAAGDPGTSTNQDPSGTGTPGGQQHPDPTTPLADDSSKINSTLTGPGTITSAGQGSDGPLFGSAQTKLAGLQDPKHAPKPNDYTGDYHQLNEDDYKQNAAYKKAFGDHESIFSGGDISHNDLDRMHFGVEEPKKLAAANKAHTEGKQRLQSMSSAINRGDIDAVGKADDILKQGEPGLDFFKFFAPAYNAWKGGGLTYAAAKQAYEAEFGMSFADYSADSKTMSDLSGKLTGIQQNLNNSYNALVPTWQGQAASNFEAKMTVFFKAAGTVSQDVATTGKDIAALVQGLQQLVLAKAQTVSELYLAELPTAIDGVMARSMVRVAMGEGDDQDNLIAFKLLSGEQFSGSSFLVEMLEAQMANRMAPRLATQWCNEILVPQFEGREQALKSVNTDTTQRIQQGFAEFTKQFASLQDPFQGMDSAGAKPVPKTPTTPKPGGGGGGAPTIPGGGGGGGGGVPSGGGGVPSGGGVHIPTGGSSGGDPTHTSGLDPSSPAVPMPAQVDPGATGTSGTTRPQGLPAGAGWIPPGVPLPQGWSEDPSTGAALPSGWSMDPTTGQPTQTAGTSGTGGTAGTGGVDPAHDIHKNKDGSVSLGPDRGLTISKESGRKGVFTLTDTDSAGTKHTYHVHFDPHGDPVVSEVAPKDDLATGPASAGAGLGGGAAIGGGSAGIGGGAGIGGAGVGGGAGAASAGHSAHADLPAGEQVGADNTMGASGAAAAQSGSPAAGSAAPGQQGEHQAGGFGGMPMGMGRGAGAGGGQEESARKYAQRGDVVGEDELEEWQRMGPVIGEQ